MNYFRRYPIETNLIKIKWIRTGNSYFFRKILQSVVYTGCKPNRIDTSAQIRKPTKAFEFRHGMFYPNKR